jgi:hypothetical protein
VLKNLLKPSDSSPSHNHIDHSGDRYTEMRMPVFTEQFAGGVMLSGVPVGPANSILRWIGSHLHAMQSSAAGLALSIIRPALP